MNLRRIALLFVVLALALPAADQGLIALLGPEAKLVAGMNIQQAMRSPFGQRLLAEIKDDDANFQKLLAETGFDPRRDLTEVVVGTVPSSQGKESIVLVRGTFDPTRIARFLQAQGGVVSTYKGVQILKSKDAKDNGAIAFPDATLAIAGTETLVKAAIDRRASSKLSLDPAVATKVTEWSGRHDAWMVSAVGISDFGPFPQQGTAPNGFSVDAVKSANAGVRFGTIIEISAEATMRSDKDAQALADVIRFVTGMLRLNQNPNNRPPEAVLSMIDKMQLSTSGAVMTLQLSIPESDLEQLINSGGARSKAPRAKAR
jgi:hypothetical protein